jgi:uncharacterized membrane protein YedE/YeeE
MQRFLIPLLCGTLFGVGLAMSGMTNTRVVLGFLDITGAWNPTLAFVMGGALLVAIPAFRIVLGQLTPLAAEQFHLPTKQSLDAKLLGGAAIFGIGWGLYGYCPGPAIAALSGFNLEPLIFVLAMAAGVVAEKWLGK